jgi:hypothetical protein
MSRFVPDTKTDTDHPKDGWSQSGTLISGNANQPVTMQANFPESNTYTVMFGVDPPPSGVFRAVAIVSWTVEGNTITRQIDIGSGVAISAPAQAVRVIVNDLTTPALGGTAGEKYGVSISVTRGIRAVASNPPTLSGVSPIGDITIFPLATGVSGLWPVPQGAGVEAVTVAASTFTAGVPADLNIAQQNAVPVILKSYRYEDQGSGDAFVALSPLATGILITNLGPTTTFVTVTFASNG